MGNKTFFRKVQQNHMSWGDIFSDVAKKHTSEQTAEVFIAGTELTTPSEEDMLSGWQKPFVFARFLGWGVLFCILLYVIWWLLHLPAGIYTLLFVVPCLIPLSCLLLIWEMNIPRNISLAEVFKLLLIGGAMSVIIDGVLLQVLGDVTAVWAPLIEEPAKLIVVYMVLKKKNRKYMTNGILVGFAVGAGFAIIESIQYTWAYGYSKYMIYFAQQNYSESEIMMCAGIGGLGIALIRALTSIPGHGGWAAMYGGALVKVKGEDELQISDLFQPFFLKYFVISFGLHALHNYIAGQGSFLGLPEIKVLPSYTDYSVPIEILLVSVIGICIFLPFLRKGVNQVVDICTEKNHGRLTQAVMRGNSGINAASGAVLSGISGEISGQTYRIPAGRSTIIGRNAGPDGISLTVSRSVSGQHCQLSWSNGNLYITDLNSTNGTWLNNQRLVPQQRYRIEDGSVIYLGNKNLGLRVKL